MKEQSKEKLLLSIYNELTPEEQLELIDELMESEELRAELAAMRKFEMVVSESNRPSVSESLLAESRSELREKLREEKAKQPFLGKVAERFTMIFRDYYKPALAGVATLAVGFLIAMIMYSPGQQKAMQAGGVLTQLLSLQGDVRINDVKYEQPDPATGDLSLSFTVSKEMNITGTLADEPVQTVLLRSLTSGENAGTRLTSVNLVAQQGAGKLNDEAARKAFITIAKQDPNPGVRLEAVKVLKDFAYDDNIKNTYLHVIENDINAGIRIEAIKNLTEAIKAGNRPDEDVLRTLNVKAEEDENNLVRVKAKTILKEYQL